MMNLIHNLLVALALLICSGLQAEDKYNRLAINGQVDYSDDGRTQRLIHNLNVGYRIKLYEAHNKSALFYWGGSTLVESVLFRNTTTVNGFITLGLEY